MSDQKRNQSNQPPSQFDISKFDDVRGLVSIAENEGDAIAYRGHAPPPDHSSGSKKLYGHILKAKNKKDVIAFDEKPPSEPRAEVDGGNNQSESPMS